MIDEIFLKAAVNIKKRYFELTGDLAKYESRMMVTKDKLEDAINRIGVIEAEVKNRKNENNSKELLNEILKVLENVDMEGKSIENFIDPINKGIELLAVEETELYRRICEKHPELTENQIVECVKERLKKENLL
jgi:hypothetical protein